MAAFQPSLIHSLIRLSFSLSVSVPCGHLHGLVILRARLGRMSLSPLYLMLFFLLLSHMEKKNSLGLTAKSLGLHSRVVPQVTSNDTLYFFKLLKNSCSEEP